MKTQKHTASRTYAALCVQSALSDLARAGNADFGVGAARGALTVISYQDKPSKAQCQRMKDNLTSFWCNQ